MKRVLIITSHFPPDRHVGSMRPGKLSKYLPQYGWTPIIMTIAEKDVVDGIDNSLLDELPKGLEIHRVLGWGNLWGNFSNRVNEKKYIIDKILLRVQYNIAKIGRIIAPNLRVRWILNGVNKGRSLIKRKKINIIFVTVPDFEANIVGLFLSILTGRKLVTDFRDPILWMTKNKFTIENSIIMVAQWLSQIRSSAIIAISKVLRRRLANIDFSMNRKKYLTIYNGFDKDNCVALSSKCNDTIFTITFVGSWGLHRSPKIFLRALERTLLTNKRMRGKIRFISVGWVKRDKELESWLKKRLSQGVLSDAAVFKNYLPHKAALKEMLEADVLLTVNSEEAAISGSLASKIFEYFYASKPILALSAEKCDLDYFLKEFECGILCSPDDTKSISDAIIKLYDDYNIGELKGASLKNIMQFERVKIANRVAKLFDAILKGQKDLVKIGW